MGLAIMPCGDFSEGVFFSSTEVGITTSINHQDHEEESDHCSPLCTCACCGLILNSTFISYQISNLKFFNSIIYANYTSPSISEVCFSIWQPPKIS